jgi:hypothetical protein
MEDNLRRDQELIKQGLIRSRSEPRFPSSQEEEEEEHTPSSTQKTVRFRSLRGKSEPPMSKSVSWKKKSRGATAQSSSIQEGSSSSGLDDVEIFNQRTYRDPTDEELDLGFPADKVTIGPLHNMWLDRAREIRENVLSGNV